MNHIVPPNYFGYKQISSLLHSLFYHDVLLTSGTSVDSSQQRVLFVKFVNVMYHIHLKKLEMDKSNQICFTVNKKGNKTATATATATTAVTATADTTQGSKLTFVLSCPWDNHKSCFGCPIESFGCPTPPYVGFHEREFGKGVTDLNDA